MKIIINEKANKGNGNFRYALTIQDESFGYEVITHRENTGDFVVSYVGETGGDRLQPSLYPNIVRAALAAVREEFFN